MDKYISDRVTKLIGTGSDAFSDEQKKVILIAHNRVMMPLRLLEGYKNFVMSEATRPFIYDDTPLRAALKLNVVDNVLFEPRYSQILQNPSKIAEIREFVYTLKF